MISCATLLYSRRVIVPLNPVAFNLGQNALAGYFEWVTNTSIVIYAIK